MNVLLVSTGYPASLDGNFGNSHLVSLGSYLQAHTSARVQLIDLDYEAFLAEPRPGEVFSEEYDLVGVSCYSSFDFLKAYYLGEERPHPDAAVLSSPALAAEIPGALRAAAQVLGRIAPKVSLPNPFDGDQLSRDETVGEAYFADPLVYTKATTGIALQTFNAQGRILDVIKSITTPTLVIHGADDTLVPPSASAPLAAVASVERKVYPGLRHEMHNEPEQTQVLGDVAAWLDSALT